MAGRFGQQKPDPAIKKNVIHARLGAKSAKRAQGFVVGASVAATLMGWALFSHEDAQLAATAQLANTTPVASIVQSATPTATPAVAIASSTR